MPWAPELFSTPTLQKLQEQRRRPMASVPYFDGLLLGELEPLIGSFAGEPELHDPVRGRIRGKLAFETFVGEVNARLRQRNVKVEDVERVVSARQGFEEVLLHIDGDHARIALPVAITADKRSDGRIQELRVYFSGWPLSGRHVNRPPVLQPDPELRESDVVSEYQSALAAGDVDGILSTFEPDGYAREPAGGAYFHRGADDLRAFYELLFSNDGGIPLEHCGVIDDGRACALEYNVVRWGRTDLPPQAGMAVYVRGQSGRLAAARIYDDVSPPIHLT
jgi:SnoaL-like protein